MHELDRIRALARLDLSVKLGKGASAGQIARAEAELDVEIRGGYRAFLERFGWAELGSSEIFGLGDQAHLNLVEITLSERTRMRPRMPVRLLPFCNDGAGNHDCLDLSAGGEPPVVFWAHELGQDQEPTVEAESFAAWLRSTLEEEGAV